MDEPFEMDEALEMDEAFERADRLIMEGYRWDAKEQTAKACECWSKAWSILVSVVPEGVTDVVQMDKLFAALAERYPSNEWVYIGWGDLYGVLRPEGVPAQYDRARSIYELGLKQCPPEKRMDLAERFGELDEERGEIPPCER